MQHSPKQRRSPRLQSDATDFATPVSSEVPQPVQKPTDTTASTQPPPATKQVEPAKASPSADTTEMKEQIALLKRLLTETNNKLAKSNRQCQSLQNALQSVSVSQTSVLENPTSTSNKYISPLSLQLPSLAQQIVSEPPSQYCQMPPFPSTSHVSTNEITNHPMMSTATTSTISSTALTSMNATATSSLPPLDIKSAIAIRAANISSATAIMSTPTHIYTSAAMMPSVEAANTPTPANIASTSTTPIQSIAFAMHDQPPQHFASATHALPPQNIPTATQLNLLSSNLGSASTLSLPSTNIYSAQSTLPTGDAMDAQAANVYAHTLPTNNDPSNSFRSVYSQLAAAGNNFGSLGNPKKLQDLPDFSGQPEDWPIFLTSFVQSTAAYNYTNLENNQRLLKCLKGDAREAVKCLLIHPDNVIAAVEHLRHKYGRPEQLIQSQLRIVRDYPQISEQNIGKIVSFATKVKNLAVFLQAANGQQHIANPTLLEELIYKLPMSKKLEWAKVAMQIQPYPTIIHFSDWIGEMASLINSIQDIDREAKRRVLLNTTEQQHRPQQQKSFPQQQKSCLLCQSQHKLSECPNFKKFCVSERWNQVKRLRVCFSCLNIGHGTRECRRKKACAQNGCQRRHHQLLHEDAAPANTPNTSHMSSESPQNVLSCSSPRSNAKLLFRILPVTLFGENCQLDVFALIDDGSSITMLDKKVAEMLGVRGKSTNLNVQWFGGRSAQEKAVTFNIHIRGANKTKRHLLRDVYAVSNLNLPPQSLTQHDNRNALNYRQSQIKPYINVVPQLLIGLDHAHLGLPITTRTSKTSFPIACNTKLGWVVYGPCTSAIPKSPNSCLFVNLCKDHSLNQLVADFFNIESIGVRSAPAIVSSDEVRASKILEETTIRIGNHFQTGLLWKNDEVTLPNSYNMALKRLESMERKMLRDENFSSAYKEVIAGYIEKGYVRKLSAGDLHTSSARKWYLPHFGVINPNKPKKLRLVFDAAAQTDGVSLNSHLLKGPQDIELLPDILFNFRRGKIAVCADIREMFHQVFVRPVDRISQRFLWRDGGQQKPIEEYEMVVMTFGAACSPCSARFVLKMNALQYSQSDPRSIEAIIQHHYIDDYVDSFDTVEQAIRISTEVRRIHASGGFDLRGFTSNSESVTRALDGRVEPRNILASEGVEKVLGIYWECSSDNFQFHLKFHRVDNSVISGERTPTKRELLSIIMSTFDPLGFLSYFIVGGKLILREVWRRECRWDEQIPIDIANSWEVWRKQLYDVANFRIPRCYFTFGMPSEVHLHVFVDASEFAFAAVAYWRYEVEGKIHVSFVTSKTKCAPLKTVSIPRLELQAAVLGTRLLQSILDGHDFSPKSVTLWSDSKTVLKWIDSKHRRYKPYVAHRVAEILSSTDISHWKWVSTHDNVADEATRSSTQVDFSPKSRWLLGPSFLKIHESEWPKHSALENSMEYDEEEIKPKTFLLVANISLIDFSRFSSLLKLTRSLAWALRFVNRCRGLNDDSWRHGLTAGELAKAEQFLIMQAQETSYSVEISCIKQSKPLPKNSCLKQLAPYIDDDGVLRVYGRIDAASYLPYSTRRPVILPHSHNYTTLILRFYHFKMKHLNHEATICEIRKKYWVSQIRRALRNIVSNYMVCRIRKAEPRAPLMGQQPRDRLEPCARPFQNTGVDYFGPLTVTIGRRTEKRWVALFTCLSVRAIHLEVAHDLSTDSFIIALKNFVNRRGVPLRMRSDNGNNFVGANEEAKRFCEVFEVGRIQDELSANGVEWIFNCPGNPSEGGVWERMVQCVKKVLRQTVKDVSPKEHVLLSLLIEAENIVNSRPLTHLPVTINEEEPLTPNHFLIGYGNVTQTPAVDEPDEKLFALRKQWRVLKSLRDRFWKRWVLEYLPTLTRRVKWCEQAAPIKVRDVVFVCDPNLPRKQWCRGIVTKVHSGADGVIRRAEVKTANGALQRPVSKLAVLDLVDGEADRSTGVGVL